MVARRAKSPGETVASLTEVKLVEDLAGEDVSEMHARSVLVGILDPVTRHEPFEDNNSTTGQETMQIGRVEAGAAPATAWPPLVAETFEDSWEECGAISALGSQQCWMHKGDGKANSPSSYGPVMEDQKSDGKSGKGPRYGKCHTCGGHWKPGRLGKSRYWWNTHVFCHRCERRQHARRSTASAARTGEEVHDVCGCELQLQGRTSTNGR